MSSQTELLQPPSLMQRRPCDLFGLTFRSVVSGWHVWKFYLNLGHCCVYCLASLGHKTATKFRAWLRTPVLSTGEKSRQFISTPLHVSILGIPSASSWCLWLRGLSLIFTDLKALATKLWPNVKRMSLMYWLRLTSQLLDNIGIAGIACT